MHYSKLKISSEATTRLRMLKQRTGLTPNLLCRIALMMSLEEGRLGNIPLPNEDGSEFNAYTLTGENTDLFLSLLRYVEDNREEPLEIKFYLIVCVGIFIEGWVQCLFVTSLLKV